MRSTLVERAEQATSRRVPTLERRHAFSASARVASCGSIARMRCSLPVLASLGASLLVSLVACSDKPAPGASASASSTASAPPAPTAPAAPRALPDDLPLDPLREALGCAKVDPEKAQGPCRVLGLAGTCKPWPGTTQGGDGRYLGRATLVEGTKREARLVILRTRTVPLADVGPGELNAKLAIALVAKDDAQLGNAERAIKAYERFDVPPKANPAVAWVKSYADFEELPAMRTTTGKVLVLDDAHAMVCEGEQQRLVLVHPAGPAAKKGDGLYAELWPVSW
jgi:hypothetical protein